MNKDFKENEFETIMDALIGFMECLPKSTIKMINPPKYRLLMQTAAQLTEFLREVTPSGEISIEIDDVFNIGSISVELDFLSVEDSIAFADIIYKADNFEIYPLTNGKMRFDITFQAVLKSIA